MECLAAAAIAFDVGVEQDGLGARVNMGIFYEVKLRSCRPKGNARRTHKGPCALATGLPALLGGLITMKLHCSARYTSAFSYHFSSKFVDEQQHGRDKRWQASGQFGRALHADGARAGGVQHKADGIDTGGHGGVHVLLACQAAHFDAGAVQGGWGRVAHGSQSYAAVRVGKPHFSSYTGP